MHKQIFVAIFILFSLLSFGQQAEIIDVYTKRDTTNHQFVKSDDLFIGRWDTLEMME